MANVFKTKKLPVVEPQKRDYALLETIWKYSHLAPAVSADQAYN